MKDNPTLVWMYNQTMDALRKRNALPKNANSAEVRYAADYIVKKSLFAPFFRALGITRGCQIGRSFDRMRTIHFFSFIVKLYYVHYFEPECILEKKIEDYFTRGDFKGKTLLMTIYFATLCSRLRSHYWFSKNRGKLRKMFAVEDLTRIEEMVNFPGSFKEFFEKFKYSKPGCIALAFNILGRQNSFCVQYWTEQHWDAIVNDFVRYGWLRECLSQAHGPLMNVDADGVVRNFLSADFKKVVASTLEFSHDMLNDAAILEQRTYAMYMKTMEDCRMFDDVRPHSEPKPEPKEEMTDCEDIFTTGSLTANAVPEEVLQLAKQLAKKHGPVTITDEASGLHIYIPDPYLLTIDGLKELDSKHLAINAEKYLGIGMYDVELYPTRENKELYKKYRAENKEVPSAVCMKTVSTNQVRTYSVEQLLMMTPIEKRLERTNGPISRAVAVNTGNKRLVDDGNGNLVCEWPGTTVALDALPIQHAARLYIENRQITLEQMKAYDVVYCTEALPEDRAVDRYYSRLPMGYKNSPANRLILPIYDENGVRQAWQARCLEHTDENGDKWIYTDTGQWLKTTENGQQLFVSEQFPSGFKKMHKYLNAVGCSRNTLLFGLKQAIEFNKDRPYNKKYAVLVEGPFDAIRGGPPCIAIMGARLSPNQAELLKKNFSHFAMAADRDVAGQKCFESVSTGLNGFPVDYIQLPDGCKDLGDCSNTTARALVNSYDPLL